MARRKRAHTARQGGLQQAIGLVQEPSGPPGRVQAALNAAGSCEAALRVRLDVRTPACEPAATARLLEVCLRFGVPLQLPERVIADGLELELRPGTVTLVTGPSGAGKSMLLAAIARQLPASRTVADVPFPLDVSVLDAVAPARSAYEAMKTLTACGLGEPMLWIRRFHQLSDGERFRARLARAISLHRRANGAAPLLCDEFGAMLHRRIAKAIAFNLRKLVTRERLMLVVATSQDDLADDLRPNTIIRLGEDGPQIERRAMLADSREAASGNPSHPASLHELRRTGATGLNNGGMISVASGLRVERGCVRDYERFAAMHYRRRDQLGFVDKVFVLREARGGQPLGVVVYGMPALELRLRNLVTGGRFARNAGRLNREVRVLKRLVIHPDVRGCGLGHWLVERTLPRVGVRFVECLAAMGAVNPVFDKAGMRRIATVTPPAEQSTTLSRLRAAGADPLAADFVMQVCRRPTIRRIVAREVFNWYRATTGGGESRVEHQTPTMLAQTYRQLAGSQPVYFIWAADRQGWAIIDRHAGGGDSEDEHPRAA